MKHKGFWVIAAVVLVLLGICLIKGEKFSRAGEKSGDRDAYVNREQKSSDGQEADSSDTEETDYVSVTKTRVDSGYYGALQVQGTALCDASGNPVQLRGVSTHGLAWYPEFVNEQAIAFMHQKWGINVVRLALYTTGSGGYCVTDEASQQYEEDLIDLAVKAAAKNQMYVIIDWHILEDGNPNSYIARAEAFFSKISEKYKDYENVLYEICNEPNGSTTWEQVKSYAEDIIPRIRVNAPDAVILVGTPDWCRGVDQAAADPVSGQKNIMYTLHFYAGSHKEELRNKADQALAAGLPIFISEFGLCDASGNGADDLDSADAWISWINEKKLSCIQWNLSNKDETSALIDKSCMKTTDWSDEELSESGRWMKENLGGIVGQQITVSDEGKNSGSDAASAGTKGSGSDDALTGTKNSGSDDALTESQNSSSDAVITEANSWDNGNAKCTQYSVRLTNSADQKKSSWKVTIHFDQSISLQNSWCGRYSIADKTLTITPEDYNAEAEAGTSIDNVGFIVESASVPGAPDISVIWND